MVKIVRFFSALREFFFPIRGYELKKFLPLLLIHCFCIFNHYCLKNLKDSLIVTAAGVEAISFLKLCMPAMTVLFLFLYTKVSDRLHGERLYAAVIGTFVAFFVLFATVLYPLRDVLHPLLPTVVEYQRAYPSLFWLFSVWGCWSYAVFFVFAELWSTFVMTILFWQFMAQITAVEEAKRTYGFLLVFGQLAVAAAGYVGGLASDIRSHVPKGQDAWQWTLNALIGTVAVTSCLAMFLYHWVYRRVLTDKRFYDKPELPGMRLKAKKKVRLRDELRVVLHSPYLALLAILVVSYAFTDNMLENFWKHEVSICFPNPNDYCTFISHYTMGYGILSIVFTLFVTAVFRKFPWKIGALVTPTVMLIGGIALFGTILFRKFLLVPLGGLSGFSHTIVQFGLVIMVLGRSGKMSFFDMSKEIAFIPLSDDLKAKGKAFVDGMGHRFGKSFGSGFQVLMLTILGSFSEFPATYDDVAPYACAIYMLLAVAWIFAVFRLNRRIENGKEA